MFLFCTGQKSLLKQHFINLIFKRKLLSKGYERIFSGIQPTGIPHLGNYFGAIKQWSALQNEGRECIFSIVDLHSITQPQDPQKLRQNVYLMASCLIACGIDPNLSILFLQSQVTHHARLAWVLQCTATMARLMHQPQYKEKSGSSENIPVGLFTYPILQSADILLYKSTAVPVGEDQAQHIQLCQHLAKVINNKYGKLFPVPVSLIDNNSARIKSLRQPDKKMSKSDLDVRSRIELTDPPDIILKRIKEAVTDCTSAVTYDPEKRTGVSNLILIHSLCTGQSVESICTESQHRDTGQYKLVVADAVVECLKPIQKEFFRLKAEPSYIKEILNKGTEKANEIASKTMNEVNNAFGLSL